MEESINTRYTFIMLLAIADPHGLVVGTDVAIARRINMTLLDFVNSVKQLQKPDPNSNSKEEDGRRVIESESERGYQLVNYMKYRNLRNEDQKREYMREYMKNRRAGKLPVNRVSSRKESVTEVGHAEGEATATGEGEEANTVPQTAGVVSESPEVDPSPVIKKPKKLHECSTEAREILVFLNESSGRSFTERPVYTGEIQKRLDEVGGDVEGVKTMIARQCAMWKNDPKMCESLCPTTLFRPSNFPRYYDNRNQPTPSPSSVTHHRTFTPLTAANL